MSWGYMRAQYPLLMAPALMGTDLVYAGLSCSAASQNNEQRCVAMTIYLCPGGICELGIRCSWPPEPVFEPQLNLRARMPRAASITPGREAELLETPRVVGVPLIYTP